MADEIRRVRTQAERDADGQTWRPDAETKLIPWLRRQLAADEQAARDVVGLRKPYYFDHIDDAARPFVEVALDPDRVVADMEAKRAIVDDCEERRSHQAFETLKLLALPYQGRAGYQADWPHSQAGWPVLAQLSAWDVLGAWAPPPRRRWWHTWGRERAQIRAETSRVLLRMYLRRLTRRNP